MSDQVTGPQADGQLPEDEHVGNQVCGSCPAIVKLRIVRLHSSYSISLQYPVPVSHMTLCALAQDEWVWDDFESGCQDTASGGNPAQRPAGQGLKAHVLFAMRAFNGMVSASQAAASAGLSSVEVSSSRTLLCDHSSTACPLDRPT